MSRTGLACVYLPRIRAQFFSCVTWKTRPWAHHLETKERELVWWSVKRYCTCILWWKSLWVLPALETYIFMYVDVVMLHASITCTLENGEVGCSILMQSYRVSWHFALKSYVFVVCMHLGGKDMEVSVASFTVSGEKICWVLFSLSSWFKIVFRTIIILIFKTILT